MPKLTIPYLDQLPHPPPLVEDALYHWQQWLRFLPSAGPRKQVTCAGIEREYANITKKLQAQYHPPELDEKHMYDWRKGEAMDGHIQSLPTARKEIILGIHLRHTPLPVLLRKLRMGEERFHGELKNTYLTLVGKLCRRK
jgi:hypothetical protein